MPTLEDLVRRRSEERQANLLLTFPEVLATTVCCELCGSTHCEESRESFWHLNRDEMVSESEGESRYWCPECGDDIGQYGMVSHAGFILNGLLLMCGVKTRYGRQTAFEIQYP